MVLQWLTIYSAQHTNIQSLIAFFCSSCAKVHINSGSNKDAPERRSYIQFCPSLGKFKDILKVFEFTVAKKRTTTQNLA